MAVLALLHVSFLGIIGFRNCVSSWFFVLLFHNENMLSSLAGSHPLVSCVFALGVITFPITGVLQASRLYIAEKKF